jgi:uncharacterized protein
MPTASATTEARAGTGSRAALFVFFGIGLILGITFIKSELASWFRIQEMFRFGSFHMYGILGSAVLVAAASLAAIRRLGLRSAAGETIRLVPKPFGSGTRYWAGGTIFGMGWALAGVCPGPIYALMGSGVSAFAVVLVAAVAGMWTYGHLRGALPH